MLEVKICSLVRGFGVTSNSFSGGLSPELSRRRRFQARLRLWSASVCVSGATHEEMIERGGSHFWSRSEVENSNGSSTNADVISGGREELGVPYLRPRRGISKIPWLGPVGNSFNYLRPSKSCDVDTTKWKAIAETDRLMLQNNESLGVNHLFHDQKLFSSSICSATLLSTAAVLGLPCKALAETCEADTFSVLNMPLLFAIAMIGATVGGLLARQRRGELKRLNDQLRQINAALRRQAKIESYAPNLSYAPVGRILETEVIIDPRKEQLIANLKSGKNFLRNQEPDKAFLEFKAALDLAKALGDAVEEKKAARGLGASLQRQGKYRDAIKYHSMVLKISERVGEDSGNTEAYGAIADCFTELGDFEQAGKFYDKYISRLETD